MIVKGKTEQGEAGTAMAYSPQTLLRGACPLAGEVATLPSVLMRLSLSFSGNSRG